ncbi:MAG: NADH-quinone oxidoreductase subunit J [Planctomycetota bacterium]
MQDWLVYLAYFVAAIGSTAVYAALPREGAAPRKSFMIPMLGLAIGGVVVLLNKFAGPAAQSWYSIILVVLALGGAVRVVTHPKPVYSALYFVMVVLSTAALMVVCGAEFLGAALVIVYAGAILVTYVFVIMLAQQSHRGPEAQVAATSDFDRHAREPFAAVAAGFVLVATVAGVIVGQGSTPSTPMPNSPDGNTMEIGRVLLTDFAVSVELAGVLLMVAMIGAIALARRRFPKHEEGPAYQPGEIGRHVKPF